MKTLLESFKILRGLPIAKTIIVKNEKNLENMNFPYYMKASIAEHKLEKNAVVKINNLNEAIGNYKRLKKQFPRNPIVIQENVNGIEMIIGIKQDDVFGKLLLIGFGGTNAEVLKDMQFLSIPASKNEIKIATERLKLYPALYKRKKYAVDKFIELAFKVSKLNVKEMDLNPVILNEKGAKIVDSRIEK